MRPDYGHIKVYEVGARVEFHPGMDIWMRGARFGRISSRRWEEGHFTYNIAPEYMGRELKIRVRTTADRLRPGEVFRYREEW